MSKIKVFYLFLNKKTTEQSDTIILGIYYASLYAGRLYGKYNARPTQRSSTKATAKA